MGKYSIKELERLSGIKAHTLRIWEQRYGICTCKRKESLHRYYDNDDLRQILRIAYLYHNGYKISKIAAFSTEEIKALSLKRLGANSTDRFIQQMLEASMDYDQAKVEEMLDKGVQSMGLEKCMQFLVYPFLEKIGLLWLTDHVIPAQEHFCSQLIQNKIIAAIDRLPPTPPSAIKRIVLFTPEGEEHEIPLLLAQYLLKKQRFKTILLGRNTSLATLEYYCKHQKPTHLYFHLITNLTNLEAVDYLQKIAALFPSLTIIAAGTAIRQIEVKVPNNVSICKSLQELTELQA